MLWYKAFVLGAAVLSVAMLSGLAASSWLAQIRRKGDNENLAEWVVDITTEADRQGSDIFVTTFQKCGTVHAISLALFPC